MALAPQEVGDGMTYIVIKHGNRRRLLAKPPTFDIFIKRSCEIFGFAVNREICAYFSYRNHLGELVELELDPSAYSCLRTGYELEWKSLRNLPAAQYASNRLILSPCYLGGGCEAIPRQEVPVCEVNWEEYPGPRTPDRGLGNGGQSAATSSPPLTPGSVYPSPFIAPAVEDTREDDVFAPQHTENHTNGNEWLHPLPSEPLPDEERWGWNEEGTPTKSTRRQEHLNRVENAFRRFFCCFAHTKTKGKGETTSTRTVLW